MGTMDNKTYSAVRNLVEAKRQIGGNLRRGDRLRDGDEMRIFVADLDRVLKYIDEKEGSNHFGMSEKYV